MSQVADLVVKDPRQVVKAGTIGRVRLLEVAAARKRIALTMERGEVRSAPGPGSARPASPRPRPAASPATALAAAFARPSRTTPDA